MTRRLAVVNACTVIVGTFYRILNVILLQAAFIDLYMKISCRVYSQLNIFIPPRAFLEARGDVGMAAARRYTRVSSCRATCSAKDATGPKMAVARTMRAHTDGLGRPRVYDEACSAPKMLSSVEFTKIIAKRHAQQSYMQ